MVYYRAGYHHGDARAALVRAAFNLARGGGPSTVTLRGAAREVGITAAAVYRHFTTVEELLAAVKCRSLRMVAERIDEALQEHGFECGLERDSEHDSINTDHTSTTPGDAAALRHRIRVVAEAYVSFAREYPGLLAMACHGGVEAAVALVAERAGDVPHPTGLAVWSAAHGVAALTGPRADQDLVLDIVLAGIVPA